MSTWTIEPLFDIEPEPIKYAKQKPDKNAIPLDDGSVKCRHCGDEAGNAYLFSISHCYCFNGWCSRRLMANHGANPQQLEWLERHEFTIMDPHDPANWDLVEEAK